MRGKFLVPLIVLFCLAWPQLAGAQDIGSVRIATVYANPFGATATACTGTAQTAQVPNQGQTGHYIAYSTQPQPTFVIVQMQGQFAGSLPFAISDAATNASGGELQANGNYPIMLVSVTCAVGGSFTLSYTGQGAPTGIAAGANLQSQVNKRLLNAVPVNTASIGAGVPITTPFGSSSGEVVIDTEAVSVWSGSPTLTVECLDVSPPGGVYASFVFPIAQNSNFFGASFPVPPLPCTQMLVLFNSSGSGGSGTFNLNYNFFPPGFSAPTLRAAHVTGTAAVSVTSVPSFLHAVSINTGAAGTISLFDQISTTCTGTPSGSVVAVITATTSSLQSLLYDVNFTQGICVKASAAMDFTISYQ